MLGGGKRLFLKRDDLCGIGIGGNKIRKLEYLLADALQKFEGERFYALSLDKEHMEKEIPVFVETKRWLDIYFSGREPDFMPPIHMIGSEFQRSVWELLTQIPYGKTITYGELARCIAKKRGLSRMSAQTVGGLPFGISVAVKYQKEIIKGKR